MRPEAAMIFAAGLGTRMGALTRERPKPLVEVGGRPLIAHALALVRGAGIGRIVVNVHAHAAMMRGWLAANAPDVLISDEAAERLETGGGLKRALPLVGNGPVVTLNADMVWSGPNPVAALRAAWEPGMGALLSLVPRPAAVGHGGPGDFFLGPDGRLVRRGAAARAEYVYAGAEVIDTGALAGFDAGVFSLNPVWDALAARGRLRGLVHAGGWADVGTPEGIALAEAEVLR